MRFGLLGTLAVWTDNGRRVEVPEAKVRALLADLLLHLGRPVPADRLIDDLWGDDLPVHPAGALHSKVSRLRQALENAEPGGGELVAFRSPGYLLQAGSDALDERRFAALIGQAGETEDVREQAELLTDALALWRGPPLADFADALFAQAAIARLEEQRLVALEEQAEARLALGEHSLLTGELGELVASHPLRERLRGAHMLALYRAGRQAEAVNSYSELRGRLADDLGLDPGPSLAALYQAILEQAAGLQRVQAPPIPAARPLTNIPAMLTDVVGRTAAVTELRALLDERRLVTLTGPGGVGKTRLALETATQSAAAFPDGVWLAELAGPTLAGARTPADVVVAVLGIRDDGSTDPTDLLAEALRASRMLLILDNCEHLVDQAAKLTARLLQAAPELRILVTSREPLMLAGEVVWAVPPLELPDLAAGQQPAALAQFSAVQLFVLRAGASAPGFRLDGGNAQAVAGLCRRLDGIPLALELAATRVRTLGVHELLARLDDRFRLLVTGHRDSPPRQQTLRAVIDWSWELLTEPERLVLRRLAITADGCGLHAAEAICAEDDLDVLGLVSRLVDRSLVVVADGPDGPRYRSLESVAAYGLQRLHQAGEFSQVRLRHRRYYTNFAERAAPRLRGHDQRSWLRRLDAEAANLRNSLDSAAQDNDAPAALRMVNALAWYWFLRGRLAEARRALDTALAPGHGPAAARATATAWQSGLEVLAGERGKHTAPPPPGGIDDPATRATLEWFHAFVASDFGDPSVGEAMVGQALASFLALGDQWGIAAALSTRAKLAMIRGDPAAAQRDARQSLTAFRELGDRWGQLQAIEWLGAAAAASRDGAQAIQLHRDGLRMAEDLGLWPQAADALSWLGRSALQSGDLAQARELLERAMRLAAGQSYHPGQVFAELGLGQTARREGKLEEAETHIRNVLRTSQRIGSGPDVARIISLSELGFIAEQRGEPAGARSWHIQCLTAARKLGDPQAMAQALIGLAGAQTLAGRPDRAAQLLGAADAARRPAGAGLPPGDGADVNRITAVTRQALGEAAFAAEFQNGRRLRPDQASSLLPAWPPPTPRLRTRRDKRHALTRPATVPMSNAVVDRGRSDIYQEAMDEPQRERDPESYFGAGIGGGGGLFTAGGAPHGPRSPAPAAPSVATVTEPAREVPVHEETDVLVVGGGPAGTAAAVAARRLGQRVTLVERYGDLGGLSAGGLVIWIDRMTDWEGIRVIAGIGAELLDRLPEGALAGPGPELWGSTDPGHVAYWRERLSAFRETVCRSPMIDPEWLKITSHEFLVAEGVRVLLHSWVVAAVSDEGTVRGAIFESKQGRRAILAKVVVDATGDLDVIAQAGGAFVTDAKKDGTGGNVQHTINTAFTWTGVDMRRWLAFKRDNPAAHHALMNRGRELLGFVDTPHVGWRDDVVVFMGPRLSGYSGLDVEHLSAVELESRRRMVAHLDFFRREAPGFENAWIMLAAPQIGIRMTRRLAGLHPMTSGDWKAGVRHPDEVGVSPSPSQRFPTVSVPYRALIPERLDGVVVGGRHVASDAATQAFMREIPQCWMTGQAAGTAAALAARTGLAPRALDVEELRKELRRQGAFLHEP